MAGTVSARPAGRSAGEQPARPRAVPPSAARLAADVQDVVDRRLTDAETAALVAARLREAMSRGGLLHERDRAGSPDGYTQHVLHVGRDGAFSVVALVWLPGQHTPVHDHLSWCVVGVLEGEETEVLYAPAGGVPDGPLAETARRRNPCGDVSWIVPPDDIHQVRNDGTGTAISLHVYGADISVLGSSIRRGYELAPAAGKL